MPETDRPTIPNDACQHPVAIHRHGTLACYTEDSCRCTGCKTARAAYDHHYNTTTRKTTAVTATDVGDTWAVGSDEWLRVMRQGLWQAVRAARERNQRRSLDLASTVGGDRRSASEVFG